MFLFFPFFHFPCKFVIPRSVGSHQFPAHQNKQNVKPEAYFLVACYATLQPALSVRPSVRPLVRPSVCPSVWHTLLFSGFCGLWPHCSCPNDLVTSNTAPAHPHATRVAVYPALFPCSLGVIKVLHISNRSKDGVDDHQTGQFLDKWVWVLNH